jgi:type IV pilus assembly protein PilY1
MKPSRFTLFEIGMSRVDWQGLTRKFALTTGMAATLLISHVVDASPLSLSQAPLFVTSGAPANLFFLADDSGSMDWNMVTPETDGNATMLLPTTQSGTLRSGSNAGSVRLATSASSTENFYNHRVIKITGGTGAGQVRNIYYFEGGSNRRAYVYPDWTVTPDTSSTYTIYTEYTYVFPQADNAYQDTADWWFGMILPSEAAVKATANMPSDAHGVWRGRYNGYNKIYYNPNVNYQPWPGVDSAGNPLPDAKAASGAIPVTALRLDPYNAGSATYNITSNKSWTSYTVGRNTGTTGQTTDISVTGYYPAAYYTWTDSNTNGIVDPGDDHTLYEIRGPSDGGCSIVSGVTVLCPDTFSRPAARTDCAIEEGDGTRTCTETEELKNFANWFMYARRREFASKNAIARVIDPAGPELRIGHGALNSTSSTVNRQVAAMNSDNATGAKKALLDRVYSTQSSGGTPLRTALDKVGKYYSNADGSIFGNIGSYTNPWLSAAAGGACQQSFVIAMTDGYYNDTVASRNASGNCTGTCLLPGNGNVDADGNSPDTAGSSTFDGGAFADTFRDTLADFAMHYYERDLNGTLANNVPVITGVDEASHQHMVTYTVGFGVAGSVGLPAGPTDPNVAYPWPDPSTSNPRKIDDLRHAAYNGRGKFLSASDPDSLANSLSASIENIKATTGSASAVAVNTRTLTTGSALFQARFISGEWSGDLRAIALDPSTGQVGAQIWSAKEKLKTQSGRVLMTRRQLGMSSEAICSSDTGTVGGVAFNWSNLSETQRCLLNDDPENVVFDSDGKGDKRLSWLRGNTADEGINSGQFRVRTGGFKLGDIANSTPVYVAAPEVTYPDNVSPASAPHSGFRSTFANRRPNIYVGANDGMLHGFNACTNPTIPGCGGDTSVYGDETIAYVPSMVYKNLSALTDTIGYRNKHQYYVDASPTVNDAFGTFDTLFAGKDTNCDAAGCWRTVLVSGLAGGGKGIFALDVTDPDGDTIPAIRFTEANAANVSLWEFVDSASATPDDDMGHIYGEITVHKMRDGSWAAIFGNGYNSENENAVLYIVNVVNGALIRKIELNPYGIGTVGNNNGLSAPTVYDRDGDYIADYIYAGDLRGNLWKIDVTDPDPNQWRSAHVDGGGVPQPLFTAIDSTVPTPIAQAITAKPWVAPHPDPTNYPNTYMVYVGTGRYVATSDKTPAAPPSGPINTMYGIWDKNVNGAATPVTRSALLLQSVSQSGSTRSVSTNAINWSSHSGWALDLRTSFADSLGEMSVTNPLIPPFFQALVFTTLVPNSDVCSFGGSGWIMAISPATGGRYTSAVFDTNGDGYIDAKDDASISGVSPNVGVLTEPVIVGGNPQSQTPCAVSYTQGSTGEVDQRAIGPCGAPPSPPPGPGSGLGRRSWRQLR